MSKKNKVKEPSMEEVIAKELGIPVENILEHGPDKLDAESDEICVFRKKLGLYVRYKK